MREIFRTFLKERIRNICMYLGFIGIFWVVFSLYDIDISAVGYAFLLSVVWLLGYGIIDFYKYVGKCYALRETSQKIDVDIDALPDAGTLLEENYQKIIRQLHDERLEIESRERISRQEMKYYYSMWAHQIKTPIAALRVLIQASEENEDEDENTRELIREMKMELFKIEQYVDMVLTYVRMENMSSDLVFTRYPLDGLVRQAVRKYSQMFILRRIRLQLDPLDRTVLTDEKWFVFVLEQILSNALKYTSEGCISIYMQDSVLVVEDTGIGIYPEDLPRVFERGFTGYNGRNNKKSTGIGLYLCKTIMTKLGHEIWIESEVGTGTKVYIKLERPEINME